MRSSSQTELVPTIILFSPEKRKKRNPGNKGYNQDSYLPFDAALLIPENNKDDLVIYMYRYIRVVIVFFVLIGIKRCSFDSDQATNHMCKI